MRGVMLEFMQFYAGRRVIPVVMRGYVGRYARCYAGRYVGLNAGRYYERSYEG
jgi:hypothetical protein